MTAWRWLRQPWFGVEKQAHQRISRPVLASAAPSWYFWDRVHRVQNVPRKPLRQCVHRVRGLDLAEARVVPDEDHRRFRSRVHPLHPAHG